MKTRILTPKHLKRGLHGLALITLPALGLTPALAQQWVATYDFQTTVKGYSTEIATDAPGFPDASAMAGTIYNYNGAQKKVHYLHLGLTGGVNSSIELDDPNYEEERAVDIVGNTLNSGATYYITCQVRPTAGANDRIQILAVDVMGTLVDDPLTISPATPNEGLYPIHSIRHSVNGDLYICGFWTDNSTMLPVEPGYFGYDHKQGFVIRYNPVSKTVVNTILINTVYTNQNLAVDDYDMALRLVEKKNGEIFVTGGVNNVKLDAFSSKEVYHSGTMNIVLDQNLNLVNESHFANGYEVWYAGDELGIGMVEDPMDPNKNYIIGNYFYRNSVVGGVFGLDAFGGFLNATWVDNAFNHINTGNSRYRFAGYDYAWALQTLPSFTTPANGGVTLLIPGMETNEWCGSFYSNDDIRPFLFDVELDYTGGNIQGYFNKWTTYRSQTGTGSMAAGSDNYVTLGDGLANILWHPTFAARQTINDNIIMSAPRHQPTSPPTAGNRLRLKKIKARSNDLESPDCLPSFNHELGPNPCGSTNYFEYQQVYDIGYGGNPVIRTYGTLNYNTNITPMSDMLTGPFGYTQDFCDPGNIVYKPTGIGNATARSQSTKIYPNPAHKDITISLGKDVKDDANVRIVLLNLYGQVIAELYTGKAYTLVANSKLSLPEVAAGLYMVHVEANGLTVHQQKLNIQ